MMRVSPGGKRFTAFFYYSIDNGTVTLLGHSAAMTSSDRTTWPAHRRPLLVSLIT